MGVRFFGIGFALTVAVFIAVSGDKASEGSCDGKIK